MVNNRIVIDCANKKHTWLLFRCWFYWILHPIRPSRWRIAEEVVVTGVLNNTAYFAATMIQVANPGAPNRQTKKWWFLKP